MIKTENLHFHFMTLNLIELKLSSYSFRFFLFKNRVRFTFNSIIFPPLICSIEKMLLALLLFPVWPSRKNLNPSFNLQSGLFI